MGVAPRGLAKVVALHFFRVGTPAKDALGAIFSLCLQLCIAVGGFRAHLPGKEDVERLGGNIMYLQQNNKTLFQHTFFASFQ